MNYIKCGLIYKPDSSKDWMHEYAAPMAPIALEDRIRIFITPRSRQSSTGVYNAYITFIDCDKHDPSRVLYVHDKPLIEYGQPGTFDEHGTTAIEILQHEGKYYLYYLGWQRTETTPYVVRMGIAVSDDGMNFEKMSEGPYVGVSPYVPYGIGDIHIIKEDGKFHMWYTHYLPWLKTAKGYRPTYDLRYAWSDNGLDWKFGPVCINCRLTKEAIASPTVLKKNGQYHMWYCYRPEIDEMGNSGPYRIGYAVADNYTDWTRDDASVSMELSPEGWDSEMMCYPKVLECSGKVYLFYGGNFYGRDGLGYAEVDMNVDKARTNASGEVVTSESNVL